MHQKIKKYQVKQSLNIGEVFKNMVTISLVIAVMYHFIMQ